MSSPKVLENSPTENLAAASAYVREVVSWFGRFYRLKRPHAIAAAADRLDITPDMAFRLHYQHKILRVAAEDFSQLERRFIAALAVQIAELEQETERLRRRKTQIELNIRGATSPCSSTTTHSSPTSPGAGCGHLPSPAT